MSLLTALRLTIAFTIVPPLLCAAGFVLAALFGCTGSFHLESCRVAGAYRVVAPLLVMGWISVFTVPVGFVATRVCDHPDSVNASHAARCTVTSADIGRVLSFAYAAQRLAQASRSNTWRWHARAKSTRCWREICRWPERHGHGWEADGGQRHVPRS